MTNHCIPSRSRVPRRPRGYSLLEVMLTSVIIQIIAGIVTVTVGNVASTERGSYAGQEVVSAIRYARQLAQTTGQPCGVIFDTDNQQVKVFLGTTTNIAPNSAFAGGTYIIKLRQQSNTTGVSIATVSLAGPSGNKVVTYGNIGATSGMPKGLGSTVNPGFITLTVGNATRTVTIPAAGEPSIN